MLDLALWRSLSLERAHIRTGFSQQHDLNFVGHFPSSADFLTTASISSEAASQGLTQDSEEENRRLAEFYEHSLAVHDDIVSSQLVPPPNSQQKNATEADTDITTTTTSTSFVSDTNSHSQSLISEEGDDTSTFLAADGTTMLKTPLRPARGGRGADHLSNLEDIPPASYLQSIVPQTVTVNLVVGIISIAAPRTVETRYGTTKTLVEVLVGDETKSGFGVTFWLPAGRLGILTGLRNQDVVLMQNVALNVFRKKVYGGSLPRDMTTVHLLYRARVVDGDVACGYYTQTDLAKSGRNRGQGQQQQLEKTKKVKDWVLNFVGGGAVVGERSTKRKTRKGKERAPPSRAWNEPPPLDSQ